MSIVDEVLGCTNDILSIRDDIGALKHPVFILTRSWSGTERGVGSYSDSVIQILPSPWLVDLTLNSKVREAGAAKQGDIMLKTISRQAYPKESDIDCSTKNKTVEKWYLIDNKLYEVIAVTREYVYWNVTLRKTLKTYEGHLC